MDALAEEKVREVAPVDDFVGEPLYASLSELLPRCEEMATRMGMETIPEKLAPVLLRAVPSVTSRVEVFSWLLRGSGGDSVTAVVVTVILVGDSENSDKTEALSSRA